MKKAELLTAVLLVLFMTGCAIDNAQEAAISPSETPAVTESPEQVSEATSTVEPEISALATETPVVTATAEPEISASATASPPLETFKKSRGSDIFYHSYLSFFSAEHDAADMLKRKIGDNDDISVFNNIAKRAGECCVALMPLIAVNGEKSIETLEKTGFGDIAVKQGGQTYTFTYADPDNGKEVIQTCEYDSRTDSMKASACEDGKEVVYLEYVYTEGGYASKCYLLDKNDNYAMMAAFFDGSHIAAFGGVMSVKERVSIYKDRSVTKDIVKNDELYCILEGKTLTVYNVGDIETY